MNRFETRLSEINKTDLLFVILYGVVLQILFGILAGMVDFYLMTRLSFSLGAMLFFFSANYIGGQVRKQAEKPHIVYTVITGVFLVVQAIIILTMPYIYSIYDSFNNISIFVDVKQYYYVLRYVVLNMLNNFRFDYIILVLFFVVGTYVGVSRTYR